MLLLMLLLMLLCWKAVPSMEGAREGGRRCVEERAMNLALEDELIEDWLQLGREGELFLGHEAVLRSSGWAALLGAAAEWVEAKAVGAEEGCRSPSRQAARRTIVRVGTQGPTM